MHWINWAIVAVYLVVVVFDGLRRTRGTTNIEGYFLANRSLPWWAVGLSVMATQLSAVTLIGTTGQRDLCPLSSLGFMSTPFRTTLWRVLLIQAVTLALLWLLQSRYTLLPL